VLFDPNLTAETEQAVQCIYIVQCLAASDHGQQVDIFYHRFDLARLRRNLSGDAVTVASRH
jgi:hypothetical protein